jgi:lysophospholipase L1-like esterase
MACLLAVVGLGMVLATGLSASLPAGSAQAAIPTSQNTSPVSSYVALGDSYTSGPSVPSQLGPGTTPSAPASCLRSSGNYPSLTARALGLELTDVSCAGATTGDLTGSQGAAVPPQLSALRPTTSVVTVGIGGNDLGFSSIVTDCAAATPWGATKVGWSCARHYDTDGTDALAAALQRVDVKVAGVLDDIRARAHRAQVFVIGYPQIVPPTGSGCWPRLPFSAADVAFLRGVESELDTALAQDAAAAGDHYVDMATPSATHNACTSHTIRWVEPLLASRHTFPVHPSAAGMAGMATVLEGAMRSDGIG